MRNSPRRRLGEVRKTVTVLFYDLTGSTARPHTRCSLGRPTSCARTGSTSRSSSRPRWWSDAVDVHVGAQAADAAAQRAEAEGDRSGARGYEDLATVLERMGRIDDARAALEQALERWERKRCLPDAGRTRERIDSLVRVE